jgi:polar amino acid transport system ATP-binding protein
MTSATQQNPGTAAAPRKGAEQPPVLVYENVRKLYGDFVALNGVSLQVNKGEVMCLIGPSGSGKSTLLRCTNALETLNGGRVLLDGIPLPTRETEVRKVRQRMGMVFQSFELFPHKTALDNVAMGPITVLGMSEADARKRAMVLLEKVGLESKAGNFPANLSGGQQQRVAIARALVLSPKILLLDEPFGALDEIMRYRMNLELLRIRAETSTTSLMVTHSIQEAVFMADRVFVLAARPGRIVDVVEVSVPRPRKLSLMNSPEFAEAVERVRSSLFGEALGMLDDE